MALVSSGGGGDEDVEGAVMRPLWEPKHEWEARVKFVEDHSGDHGLEKAINLSLVWANMKFLGCSYPGGTEALVAHYPLPSLEELRARRKCKNSIAKYKKKAAGYDEVSALLTSIHTQSSIRATHPQLQVIANETCLCKECLVLPDNETYCNKGLKVLEHLKKSRDNFEYEFSESEVQPGSKVWSLTLNGEVVLKRDTDKSAVLEDFVKMLDNWQEANQKPACPSVANSQQPSASGNDTSQTYSDYYSNSSPYQGGYQGSRDSSYQGTPRRGYGSPYQNSSRGGRGSPYQDTPRRGRGSPYQHSPHRGHGSPYQGGYGRY